MPIRPRNIDNARSVELGAAHEDHEHAHADLTGVSSDQHHAQDHAARHADGGADELDASDLASGAASDGDVLTADGAGAAAWEAASAHTHDHGANTGLGDDDHTQYLLADGTRQATFIDIGGLTGAIEASRIVGSVDGGPPTSGTFVDGDIVAEASDAGFWVCRTGGTPGTWDPVGVSDITNHNYYSGMQAGAGHTGARCVAIGSLAMDASSSANDSVAIGAFALTNQTTGSTNFGIGFRAGITLTTGSGNMALGNAALLLLDTGNDNTAVGSGSLQGVVGGFRNTGVGASAATSYTGSNSTFVGRTAGLNVQTGDAHVFVGYLSGFAGTTQPIAATVVGAESKAGDGNFGTTLGYKTTVSAAGAVAIGTDSGGVGASSAVANRITLGTANHSVFIPGNVGFYGTTPVAQSAAYTPTNVTTDRAYDANATTTAELADVLGTLIADLQATGLIG